MSHRKNKKPRLLSQESSYMFSSHYEERKTYEYLRNLIGTIYLYKKTEELFDFAVTAIGHEIFSHIIKHQYSEKLSHEDDFNKWKPNSRNNCPLAQGAMITILENDIVPLVNNRIRALSRCPLSEAEKRLIVIQNTFGLTNAEREIIAFNYLKQTCQVLRNHLDNDSRLEDFSLILRFRQHGDKLLGLARSEFLRAFTNEMIFKAQIIEINRSTNLEITPWAIDYVSGIGSAKLDTQYFTKENNETLKIADFSIHADEMLIIDSLIKSKKEKNLLFYGSAGVGKTSFARCLAKKYGKELYTVKIPSTDDLKERIRSIYATVNLADAKKAIVLIDESDELLNTMSRNTTSKSWINNFLDTHGKKIIWITNRSSEIDASTMRRFQFSIEFKQFDNAKRLKVLKHSLSKKHIPEGYFRDDDLKDLCRNYAVNASGIIHAIEVADINKRTSKDNALRRIKTVLKNHEKAIGAVGTRDKVKSFDQYSFKSLNTSVDLHSVVTAVQKMKNTDSSSNTSLSMLLFGEPGTGKTEFVRYLGSVINREIFLKRASDIKSMFVGETEKNIAEAFRDASDREVVLFFDEADSFLFPRSQAMRSFEKSFTNEILTQIENHQGIVIFATNDIGGLDHAALRRFGFKIRFNPLKPDGNVQIYEKLLMPFADNKLTSDEIERLRNIKQLTHGDFVVIKKQLSLLGNDGITHEKLIASLESEVRYKKMNKVVGF